MSRVLWPRFLGSFCHQLNFHSGHTAYAKQKSPRASTQKQSPKAKNRTAKSWIDEIDSRYESFGTPTLLSDLEACSDYESQVEAVKTVLRHSMLDPQAAVREDCSRSLLPAGVKAPLPPRHVCARVNAVLEATVPLQRQMILARWQAKMAREMGKEKFADHMKTLRRDGSGLHTAVQCILVDEPVSSEAPLALLSSVQHVLRRVQHVHAVEDSVAHPSLAYAGYMDACVDIGGRATVVEWKTSSKVKSDLSETYDAPLQLTAYLGALNHDPSYGRLQVDQALIAYAHPDGQPASVFLLRAHECQQYWEDWLARLSGYWLQVYSDKNEKDGGG